MADEQERFEYVEITLRQVGNKGTELTSIYVIGPESFHIEEKRDIEQIRDPSKPGEIKALVPKPETHRVTMGGRVVCSTTPDKVHGVTVKDGVLCAVTD